MDFSFSEEQTLIKNAVEKFIQNDYDFETRNKIIAGDEGFDRGIWKQFADLGWLGISFPEEVGGFGGSAVETNIVMEAFGGGMVVEPFLSTVVLGGNALAFGGTDAQKQEVLAKVISGDVLLALAYGEAQSRYDLSDVKTSAEKKADQYVLNGEKTVVFGGAWADKVIVSARTSGDQCSEQGITLFLVDAKAEGVSVNAYKSMDGARMANVSLNNVSVGADAIVGSLDEGFGLLEKVIDYGISALCAEALGSMNAAYEKTLAYVKTREQFGVAIGSFQVIQHRLVDMFMAVESSRSMGMMVALKLGSRDVVERKKAASAAKVYIGDNARYCAQEAVQLHGGIGVTEELDIGHYFRRLTLFCGAFGSTDYHLSRFADLGE
ncbi:MAG: pimeloyl-CoA dehydrogenase small subunit [Moraxellaceae bacterium]|nr:MAG: pimeloyl-CoA dehydrogenase small subunit [Moraxellaceae bacterium]